MSKTAFITGVTSGIGRATAVLLAQNGFKIIATGRRQERLKELEKELEKYTDIITLNFDVRERDNVLKAIEGLPQEWKAIDLLINNAGNAHGLTSIEEGSMEDWNAMIDINVKGLLHVSQPIIKTMVQHKKGHIINIGSVAGKETYPNGNIYCASKFAVDAINSSMRMDLNKHGIKVSQVAPGLVETEFSLVRFKGDEERAGKVYENFEALKAEDIAELILFMATRPAHVNLADVLIFPTAQATATMVNKG
ncbi:NAD(P)-dependent oxidoreductase [Marivirga lumbricoides]|uniref:NAD(P)-dependent oxidoreductase n=1 Tax=Marivirga lumbricoides TaxID=1046115 RepID=A0A2T4DQ28_9BACT|nr:NAD(P)-dependent oxidoreductase [Marivirga lumbricoides]